MSATVWTLPAAGMESPTSPEHRAIGMPVSSKGSTLRWRGRLTSAAMINDRRDDVTLAELVEELELSYPEKVASFERRYPDAMAAVADDDLGACNPDELDELASALRNLLRV
jgi:hypothetical protein